MPISTTIVCGLGDNDTVTFIEEDGKRLVIDMNGAPLEAFNRIMMARTGREVVFSSIPISLRLDARSADDTIEMGSRFGLYINTGNHLHQFEPFFRASVFRHQINQSA